MPSDFLYNPRQVRRSVCVGSNSKPVTHPNFHRMPSNRTLSSCPDSPNCVSSLASDAKHYVAPLQYKGDLNEAGELLRAILRSMQRMRIVVDEPTYIHAEFTSALFRFVDDVEFLFAEPEKIIHVRSASRVGYYDFGANHNRIERIRNVLSGRHAMR